MERRTSAVDELRRVDTVGTAIRYFATVVVSSSPACCPGELGISIAPILATAGVAGVAIGFGAQSLIKDYFSGFSCCWRPGARSDIVEIAGKRRSRGVTLRYVRLRDGDGFVYFIPNGEIKMVINRTRQFAYAMIDAQVGSCATWSPRWRRCASRRRNAQGPGVRPRHPRRRRGLGVERWEIWGLGVRGRIKVLPRTRTRAPGVHQAPGACVRGPRRQNALAFAEARPEDLVNFLTRR